MYGFQRGIVQSRTAREASARYGENDVTRSPMFVCGRSPSAGAKGAKAGKSNMKSAGNGIFPTNIGAYTIAVTTSATLMLNNQNVRSLFIDTWITISRDAARSYVTFAISKTPSRFAGCVAKALRGALQTKPRRYFGALGVVATPG